MSRNVDEDDVPRLWGRGDGAGVGGDRTGMYSVEASDGVAIDGGSIGVGVKSCLEDGGDGGENAMVDVDAGCSLCASTMRRLC